MAIQTGLGDSIRTLGMILQNKSQEEEASLNRSHQRDLTQIQNEKEAYQMKAQTMQRQADISLDRVLKIQDRIAQFGLNTRVEQSEGVKEVFEGISNSLYNQVQTASALAADYKEQGDKLALREESFYSGLAAGKQLPLEKASMLGIYSDLHIDKDGSVYNFNTKGEKDYIVNKIDKDRYDESSYLKGIAAGAKDIKERLNEKLTVLNMESIELSNKNTALQMNLASQQNTLSMARELNLAKTEENKILSQRLFNINASNDLSTAIERAQLQNNPENASSIRKEIDRKLQLRNIIFQNASNSSAKAILDIEPNYNMNKRQIELHKIISSEIKTYMDEIAKSLESNDPAGLMLDLFGKEIKLIDDWSESGDSIINKAYEMMNKNSVSKPEATSAAKIIALMTNPLSGADPVSRLILYKNIANLKEMFDKDIIKQGATTQSNKDNVQALLNAFQVRFSKRTPLNSEKTTSSLIDNKEIMNTNENSNVQQKVSKESTSALPPINSNVNKNNQKKLRYLDFSEYNVSMNPNKFTKEKIEEAIKYYESMINKNNKLVASRKKDGILALAENLSNKIALKRITKVKESLGF